MKQEQQRQAKQGTSTNTNLENRPSKRNRINEAKQKYAN